MSVRFRSQRAKVVADLKSGVDRNLAAAGEHLTSELRKTLRRGSRTGAFYRVPGGVRKLYQASAPGEPPAVATGRLADSYVAAPVSRNRVLIGSELKYARFLELGTVHMAPRPHFERTFKAERRSLQRILGRTVIR